MNKETKTAGGYKAPTCRVVIVHVEGNYLQTGSDWGEDGEPGSNGSFDDES